jgi:hypothetical protein
MEFIPFSVNFLRTLLNRNIVLVHNIHIAWSLSALQTMQLDSSGKHTLTILAVNKEFRTFSQFEMLAILSFLPMLHYYSSPEAS